MQKTSVAILLLSVCMVVYPSLSSAVQPGEVPPEIAIPNKGSLSSMKGRVVYVDFWASWCGPCQRSLPWMQELHRKFENRGLEIVTINVDEDRSEADEFLERTSSDLTVVFDPLGKLPEAYSVEGMPSSFLIGPDGKVFSVYRGFNDKDKLQIEEDIEHLLERSEVR